MSNGAHAVPALAVEEKPDTTEHKPFRETTFTPTESTNEPPLSLYETIHKEPFSVSYFELDMWPEIMQRPQFDVTDLKGQVNSIEEYVHNQIKERGFRDSVESYVEIMQELRTKLKIHPLEEGHNVFRKILSYINKHGIQRRKQSTKR